MTLNQSHKIGTLGTLATPTGDHVLTDQIYLSYFDGRSFSDHFLTNYFEF